MHDFHAYHRDPIYYPWCEDCTNPKRTQQELKAAVAKVQDALAGEPEITVRVKGGSEALKAALEAAEVSAFEIIHRHPKNWQHIVPGATGTVLDGPYGLPERFFPSGASAFSVDAFFAEVNHA